MAVKIMAVKIIAIKNKFLIKNV